MKRIYFLILVSVLMATLAEARILNVPSESYPAIQDAIDEAQAGDTVLVSPGTCNEHIDFSGKSILVAGQYILTGDTAMISQTIIQPARQQSIVTFQSQEDSTSQLTGFTLRNSFKYPGSGAAIECLFGSGPTLSHLKITDNTAGSGGGIRCFDGSNAHILSVRLTGNSAINSGGAVSAEKNCHLTITNSVIHRNSANDDGAGVMLTDSSSARITASRITENSAAGYGAGIYCDGGGELILDRLSVTGNFSENSGGGMYLENAAVHMTGTDISGNSGFTGGGICMLTVSSAVLKNCMLTSNRALTDGGGLMLINSTPSLSDNRVYLNSASESGGAMYLEYSDPAFDQQDRNSVYANHAGLSGSDIYRTSDLPLAVSLDTFTVESPSDYELMPVDGFILDMHHALISPVSGDLYVSPSGDDGNSGLSALAPLQTLHRAQMIVRGEQGSARTLFLEEGTYSYEQTGEFFPVRPRSHVHISGDHPTRTILDAGEFGGVMTFSDSRENLLENVTLAGGYRESGAGIYCLNSDPVVQDIIVTSNSAARGAGIHITGESSPTILNTTITDNKAWPFSGGAGLWINQGHVRMANSIIWNNGASQVIIPDTAASPDLAIAYSDISDSLSSITSPPGSDIFWLVGNRAVDPLFRDPANRDYRLSAESPLIDQGAQDITLPYDNNADTLNIPDRQFIGLSSDMGAVEFGDPTPVQDHSPSITAFELKDNFPNPFNPVTTFSFRLSTTGRVSLIIFDVNGRHVEQLIDGTLPEGYHEYRWNASAFSSGIYYYQLKTDEHSETKKCLLLK